MSDKKLDLTIKQAVRISKPGVGKYDKYSIQSDLGQVIEAAWPSDVNYEPKEGDQITLYKGQYGWFSKNPLGGESVPSSSGGKRVETSTKYASRSKGATKFQSDDYWTNKDGRDEAWTEYQMDIRDPKIEFQSYFNTVCGMYEAAVGNIKSKMEPSAIDEYIDAAFRKAQSLYLKVNKNPRLFDEAEGTNTKGVEKTNAPIMETSPTEDDDLPF